MLYIRRKRGGREEERGREKKEERKREEANGAKSKQLMDLGQDFMGEPSSRVKS